ncbi:MAG: hypothetical protein OEO79_09460 [Gemmatimonadota bacterium]|nr:hypothetical protein [Gemmatimonadota bacterium]
MIIRLTGIGVALFAMLALDMTAATAQISGRVELREGPVAVNLILGRRSDVTYRRPHGQVVVDRRPMRYEPGMDLLELERYLDWVKAEYRTFKRMDEDEAWYHLGWNERQLDDYVDSLKDERKWLKRERKRLRRLVRDWDRVDYGEWRGGWDDDEWEEYWEDRDEWDDERLDDHNDRDDDDRRLRGRRGRGRVP